MSIVGIPGAEPCKVQAPVVDVMTGHIACTAILAKLMQRARDGKGGHLDVNLMNSAIALQLPTIASYLSDGALPTRMASAAPYSAPNEAFETADGWIMVAAYMGDRWPRLCRVLGHDEWIGDPCFASSKARTSHRAQLRDAMNAAFRSRTTADWLPLLLAEDILCARVAGYDDLVAHPQVAANGMLTRVEVPGHGGLTLPGFPVNSADENARPSSPAPTLGQHNRQVLEAHGIAAI